MPRGINPTGYEGNIGVDASGNMTLGGVGKVILSLDDLTPTQNDQVASKLYVDAEVASAVSALPPDQVGISSLNPTGTNTNSTTVSAEGAVIDIFCAGTGMTVNGDDTLKKITFDVSGINTATSTAQTTANTAQTTANTAQTTANTAQTTANTAQTTANTAQTTATAAQTTANNALPKVGGTLSGALILPTGNSGAMALGIGSQTSTHGFYKSGNDIRVHVGGVEVAYFDVGGLVSNFPTYSKHTGNAANPSYTWNSYFTSGLFNNAGTIGLSVSGNAILSITGTTTTMGGNIVMGTGQITIPSGSLANPSIRLSSSANTGIYSSGTTNLSLVSNGVASITATSTGSTLTGTTDISTLTNCGYAVIYSNAAAFPPLFTNNALEATVGQTAITLTAGKLIRLYRIGKTSAYMIRIVFTAPANKDQINGYIPEFTNFGLSTAILGINTTDTGRFWKYSPDTDGLFFISANGGYQNGNTYDIIGSMILTQDFD